MKDLFVKAGHNGQDLKRKIRKKQNNDSPSSKGKILPGTKDWELQGPCRELLVDSGASSHMVCKKDLSPTERLTLRPLEREIPIQTANGIIVISEGCEIYVRDLDMKVFSLVLPATAHVLSLCFLCTIHGYDYHSYNNPTPYLSKHGTKR